MGFAIVTKDIAVAAAAIAEGRVVAFPTGTSYGLAVDALQGHALQRLRTLKKRPDEKTFTVFMRRDLWQKFLVLTAAEQSLLEKYANQALTLLVEPKPGLAHLAQDGLIGLRVIDHPLMAALAQAASVPLTATSANVSGGEPCYSPAAIDALFPGILDPTDPAIAPAGPTTYDLSLAAILDGGTLPVRKPTTIARLSDGQFNVIRQGELQVEQS